MTYILSNEKGSERRFSDTDWWHLYKLAEKNGWDWEDTKLDPDTVAFSKGKRQIDEEVLDEVAKWDGSYFPKSHQKAIVTEKSALNWATTLENVLNRSIIPDEPLSEHDKKHPPMGIVTLNGLPVLMDATDSAEYFGGDKGKEMLRDFIAFCQEGEFSISCKPEKQA